MHDLMHHLFRCQLETGRRLDLDADGDCVLKSARLERGLLDLSVEVWWLQFWFPLVIIRAGARTRTGATLLCTGLGSALSDPSGAGPRTPAAPIGRRLSLVITPGARATARIISATSRTPPGIFLLTLSRSKGRRGYGAALATRRSPDDEPVAWLATARCRPATTPTRAPSPFSRALCRASVGARTGVEPGRSNQGIDTYDGAHR